MAKFTQTRDNRRQTMDHNALGMSFETANLSQKNHGNVHVCQATESILPLSRPCRKGESG